MQFTEEDIPLMKLIFNPETHSMGMMIGQRRAEEIFYDVCNKIGLNRECFIRQTPYFFERILRSNVVSDLFWGNNILNLSLLDGRNIKNILIYSLISEEFLVSDKADFKKLTGNDVRWLLTDSPIAEKIWDSGKLDLHELDSYYIYYILTESRIAKKIFDSSKLNISLLTESEIEEIKKKIDK